MKYVLIALLLLTTPMWTSAQKNNLFADVGLSGDGSKPGLSVTYSYKFAKHIGVGIGIQDYRFQPTITNHRQFVPAVFEDMRFYFRVRKNSMFFSMLDLGFNFYEKTNYYYRNEHGIYTVPQNNGVYMGLGFGYFHRVTRRGGGLYASFKMVSNTYKADRYLIAKKVHDHAIWMDATTALSIGFKF